MNNLAKYSAGQVNVCGVNHFSATNTKIGNYYKEKSLSKDKKTTFGSTKRAINKSEV